MSKKHAITVKYNKKSLSLNKNVIINNNMFWRDILLQYEV